MRSDSERQKQSKRKIRGFEQQRYSDLRDEDVKEVPPPKRLLALFVVPLAFLLVWAFTAA